MEAIWVVRGLSLQLLVQGSPAKNRQERKTMLISEWKYTVKYRAVLAQPLSVPQRISKEKSYMLSGWCNYFWKYSCDNFLMRAQNKMTISYHGKPSNAREGNKHKPMPLSQNTKWEILQSAEKKKKKNQLWSNVHSRGQYRAQCLH